MKRFSRCVILSDKRTAPDSEAVANKKQTPRRIPKPHPNPILSGERINPIQTHAQTASTIAKDPPNQPNPSNNRCPSSSGILRWLCAINQINRFMEVWWAMRTGAHHALRIGRWCVRSFAWSVRIDKANPYDSFRVGLREAPFAFQSNQSFPPPPAPTVQQGSLHAKSDRCCSGPGLSR